MAEFQEVCKQWRRMCEHGSEGLACANCKMYSSVDESVCRGLPDEDEAKIIESFVMSWAAEHPEPVYPSVAKYLEQFGIIIRRDGTLEADFFKANEPMSADIAQKLGIEPMYEPKEVQHE